GYPPQQGYPPSGYPPQQGYPPAGKDKHDESSDKGMFSNLAHGIAGAATHGGGYPPQHGYPPQQGGYPPSGYPPQQGYPPSGYPPQQGPTLLGISRTLISDIRADGLIIWRHNPLA
ncbi:glycine-rich protein, partial [Trifolium medium]|nr:glycine-rich protein [Trifolium medium]